MGRKAGGGRTVYCLYRGNEVVGTGTAEQLAQTLGVRPDTIRWLSSPANKRRDKGNRLVAERVER